MLTTTYSGDNSGEGTTYSVGAPRAEFSLFDNQTGLVGKEYRLNDAGELDKIPHPDPARGQYERLSAASIEEVMAHHARFSRISSCFFTQGVAKNENAQYFTTKKRRTSGSDVIARCKEDLIFPENKPGAPYIDFDLYKCTNVPKEWRDLDDLVCEAHPKLREVRRAWYPGNTAFLYRERDGLELRGAGSWRLRLLVDNAAAIPRLIDFLFQRLWALGHGWIEPAKDGDPLIRTLIDGSTGRSDLPDFLAPILNPGCGVVRRLPEEFPQYRGVKRMLACADVPEAEPMATWRKSNPRVLEAKKAAKTLCDAVKAKNVEARLPEFRKDNPGVADEELRRTIQAATEGRALGLDFVVYEPGWIPMTVRTLLALLEFGGKPMDLLDPAEPDYDGGRPVAMAYFNREKGNPCINSFAHGGHDGSRVFDLTQALKELQVTEANKGIVATPAAAANEALPGGFLAEDVDNCRRFARQHGEDVRYIPERKKWIIWNGARWVADAEGLERRAKETIDGVLKEAALMTGPALPMALKAATDARRKSRVRGMTELAQTEKGIAVSAADLDANPWILGVKNGVIELKTGVFRKYQREDYITKFAGTDFVPGRQCPDWLAFLATVMAGDVERIAYLQRFTGYMLTGSVREEAVLLLFGVGRNGKSTFREVLSRLLGAYALTCSSGLLIERRQSESASPEVAALKGVRLASVNETAEDGVLREERLKFIASNEPISARYLYENDITFPPTHKLIITTNHKPIVKGSDLGIWRRLHPVRFGVTIPEDKVETDFRERRLEPEMPGILNWALEGLAAYLKGGLREPAAIKAERAAYREELDIVGSWIEENCVCDRAYERESTRLFGDFVAWSERETGIKLSQTRFGRELEERGYTAKRDSNGRKLRVGLQLKTDPKIATLAVSVATPLASGWTTRAEV